MNILIANDDGIGAKGIKELARALSQIANIYVCAPHTQRSALRTRGSRWDSRS